jgi:hypothetical protein
MERRPGKGLFARRFGLGLCGWFRGQGLGRRRVREQPGFPESFQKAVGGDPGVGNKPCLRLGRPGIAGDAVHGSDEDLVEGKLYGAETGGIGAGDGKGHAVSSSVIETMQEVDSASRL